MRKSKKNGDLKAKTGENGKKTRTMFAGSKEKPNLFALKKSVVPAMGERIYEILSERSWSVGEKADRKRKAVLRLLRRGRRCEGLRCKGRVFGYASKERRKAAGEGRYQGGDIKM